MGDHGPSAAAPPFRHQARLPPHAQDAPDLVQTMMETGADQAQAARGSTDPHPAGTPWPQPQGPMVSWTTSVLSHSGSQGASPLAPASPAAQTDGRSELVLRDPAPAAVTSGLRLNPGRPLNEAWCRGCDSRFTLVALQNNDMRGHCMHCGRLTEVVTINSTHRSGAWMVNGSGSAVWPCTWVDMWADRRTSVSSAPTSPNSIVEGEVLQNEIYTSLVGRLFHFDPCCSLLTQGVNEDWYRDNQGLDPTFPNQLGSIDVAGGRGLKPCPLCAMRFIRPSKSGR